MRRWTFVAFLLLWPLDCLAQTAQNEDAPAAPAGADEGKR